MEFVQNYKDEFLIFEDYLLSVAHQKHHFKKGEHLTLHTKNYYYLLEGKVQGSVVYESGKSMTTNNFERGAIFPYYSPHYSHQHRNLFFSALTDGMVLMIETPVMKVCLQENTDFNQVMYAALSQLCSSLADRLAGQVFMTGLVNLCRLFCRALESKAEPDNVLFFTQDELSLYIGLDRSNIARCLKQLRDKGIVETGRNKIIIKNIENLYAEADLPPQ